MKKIYHNKDFSKTIREENDFSTYSLDNTLHNTAEYSRKLNSFLTKFPSVYNEITKKEKNRKNYLNYLEGCLKLVLHKDSFLTKDYCEFPYEINGRFPNPSKYNLNRKLTFLLNDKEYTFELSARKSLDYYYLTLVSDNGTGLRDISLKVEKLKDNTSSRLELIKEIKVFIDSLQGEGLFPKDVLYKNDEYREEVIHIKDEPLKAFNTKLSNFAESFIETKVSSSPTLSEVTHLIEVKERELLEKEEELNELQELFSKLEVKSPIKLIAQENLNKAVLIFTKEQETFKKLSLFYLKLSQEFISRKLDKTFSKVQKGLVEIRNRPLPEPIGI